MSVRFPAYDAAVDVVHRLKVRERELPGERQSDQGDEDAADDTEADDRPVSSEENPLSRPADAVRESIRRRLGADSLAGHA